MKKCIGTLFILSCLVLLQNCKGHGGKNFIETSDTVKFFPINLYFKGQIARVDSLATTIYKLTIRGNGAKPDSTTLTKQQFNQLAHAFTEYDIEDKSIHKYYKESTFGDASTQSITFNYTAMDKTLPLQSIDILLDQTGQQMKNVFLSLMLKTGDSTVTEKCGWKNDTQFYINRYIEYPGKPPVTEQNIIVWQFQP